MEEVLSRLNVLVPQLSPEQASRVVEFAAMLHLGNSATALPCEEKPLERTAAIAALQYFDSLHPEDDWSDLIESSGAS